MNTATEVLVIVALIAALPVAVIVLVALLRGYSVDIKLNRRKKTDEGD